MRSTGAAAQFQQFKGDEFPVQDPEFDTYRDKLEAQIKQVDQMQKCLGSFYTSLLGTTRYDMNTHASHDTILDTRTRYTHHPPTPTGRPRPPPKLGYRGGGGVVAVVG